jgi:tetratricopeptide (TPR) repeat protein
MNSFSPWRYEGVLHEYLTCDIPHDLSRIEGLTVRSHADGARNVDPGRKYAHDVEILERAARLDPDNPRNIFYLAQSYRDLGNLGKAVAEYERRIALGGWYEEVWYAMFQIGVLEQQLGRAFPAVLSAHLRAYQFHPARAEPLCTLAMHYRTTGEWALAELFAREAAAKPASTDILFVDSSVYEWRALDELAIATYYVGKFRESIDLNLRLLAEGRLPESERRRVEGNLGFAASKLGGGRP